MMRIAISIQLMCFALTAFTQVQKKIIETTTDSFYLLAPVEVRAVRLSENAPFAKTNISEKELQKINFGQDLPQLLQNTPSLVANSDAGNGFGYTGLRIRGSDATRINITLNGIPFNDAESQATYFVDLPDFVSSVNNIQIQRGVGSSTNGGGAFGGSINISTNDLNKEKYLELNNSYGSYNSLKSTLKFGSGIIKNHFILDGRLSYLHSDGYIDRAESKLRSGFFSAVYLMKKSSIRINTIFGKESTYHAWYGIDAETLKTNRRFNPAGTEKSITAPYKNQTDNYWQNHYQLFYTHTLNTKWELSNVMFLTFGKGYYEEYKADRNPQDYGIAYITANTDLVRQKWLKTYFFGQQFNAIYKNKNHNLILSGGWSSTDGQHFGKVIWTEAIPQINVLYYNQPAYKTDINTYAKWNFSFAKHWNSFLDMQYRAVFYKINGFENNKNLIIDRKFNFFNPKVGISFKQNNWQLYGSYAVGSKEPNRDDFEASAQTQPKPEYLSDFEWGVQKSSEKFYGNINFYAMLYKDQLVVTGKINDIGAYPRINVPQSYRLGVEIVSQYKITNWLKILGNITFSKNKIKSFTEYIDDWNNGNQIAVSHNNTNIAFSPQTISTISLEVQPIKSFTISLNGNGVSKQYLDNSQSEEKTLPAYFFSNFIGSYNFKKGIIKDGAVSLQINNLFSSLYSTNGWTYTYIYNNETINDNHYFPSAEINFMIGLHLKF